MPNLREQIQAELDDAKTPLQKEVAAIKARAKIVVDQWVHYPGRNAEGVATFRVGQKDVSIGDIEYTEVEGVPAVEVWTGPRQGPPQFRIINPPLLVQDREGAVEVAEDGTGRVERYRGDPVAAIAETIGGRNKR